MPRPATVALSGTAALAVAMGIGRFAFTPILPMMQAEHGLSLVDAGRLASANYFGYLAGALWAVRPAPPRLAILAALVSIALSTLAMGFAHNLAAWLALRFLAGVASAWALVHVSSWCLARLATLHRARFNGLLYAGVGLGVAAAGVICLALMNVAATAEQAWLVLGALSIAVTAALWPLLGVDAAVPARSPTEQRFRWSLDGALLVACYGAFGFGYIIPATFVPVM